MIPKTQEDQIREQLLPAQAEFMLSTMRVDKEKKSLEMTAICIRTLMEADFEQGKLDGLVPEDAEFEGAMKEIAEIAGLVEEQPKQRIGFSIDE